MIKKIFKSLLLSFIFGLGIINFSSADCPVNSMSDWLSGGIHPIGGLYTSPYSSSYDVGVLNYGDFSSSSLGVNKKLFVITGNILMWWDIQGLPYLYGIGQGNFDHYFICDELTGGTRRMNTTHCTNYSLSSSDVSVLSNFLSTVSTGDYWGYYYQKDSTHNRFQICISSSTVGNSLCFVRYTCSYNSTCHNDNCNLTGSLDYTDLTFANIPDSILFDSPGISSGGGNNEDINNGGIEIGSNESAINYFESNYGWNENICYVGIDNVTDLWGSSVSFNEGSGLNIFQVFSGLYGNSDLDKVYVWVNNWLINYEQWFYRDTPLYLSNYNSGSNIIDLYYDNLSFPFANNPVAVYFMANNIESKSNYSTMGSEVVSYCNLKINGGSFEDIIDQSVKNNIDGYTEQSNINKGLNSDGTNKNVNYLSGSYIVTGSFGSGTDVSWEDLVYTGDIEFENFFDHALNEMKFALDNFQNPFTGILPQYIISAFLFVVLFKLLRK